MEIDKLLYSMIPLYEDKELLYSDIKKKFSWNDSQVKAAVDPILNRKLVELKTVTAPTSKAKAAKPKKTKTAKPKKTKLSKKPNL